MGFQIPKFSRKKYEIATKEAGNPIKQDEKKGKLREFKRGDLQFNYGEPSSTVSKMGLLMFLNYVISYRFKKHSVDPAPIVTVRTGRLPSSYMGRPRPYGSRHWVQRWPGILIKTQSSLSNSVGSGDNDPIDVCEVGLKPIPTGGIRSVKVNEYWLNVNMR